MTATEFELIQIRIKQKYTYSDSNFPITTFSAATGWQMSGHIQAMNQFSCSHPSLGVYVDSNSNDMRAQAAQIDTWHFIWVIHKWPKINWLLKQLHLSTTHIQVRDDANHSLHAFNQYKKKNLQCVVQDSFPTSNITTYNNICTARTSLTLQYNTVFNTFCILVNSGQKWILLSYLYGSFWCLLECCQ